jgi:hypothetical protein
MVVADGHELLGPYPARVCRSVDVVEADTAGVDDEVRALDYLKDDGDEAAPA